MNHRSCFDPNDQTWHFQVSKRNPACLKQVLQLEERDSYGIMENTIVRPPVTYCGYTYMIDKGPPSTVVRSPIPGHAFACGLVDCWRELSDYWMGSRSKTAVKLFDEYWHMHRYVKWGQPWKILRYVSRDRVNELCRLVRRSKTPPHGYDASHVDIAPRVAKRAGELYDKLKTLLEKSA